jgi:hypothetical protein
MFKGNHFAESRHGESRWYDCLILCDVMYLLVIIEQMQMLLSYMRIQCNISLEVVK